MTFRSRRFRMLMTWSLLCLTFLAGSPRPTCICENGGRKVFCAKVLSRFWRGKSAKLEQVPACCEHCQASETECLHSGQNGELNAVSSGSCKLVFTTLDCRVLSSNDANRAIEAQSFVIPLPYQDLGLTLGDSVNSGGMSNGPWRSIPRQISVLLI
jgi:hypothetical protein